MSPEDLNNDHDRLEELLPARARGPLPKVDEVAEVLRLDVACA
jgi:hypothetical protein